MGENKLKATSDGEKKKKELKSQAAARPFFKQVPEMPNFCGYWVEVLGI